MYNWLKIGALIATARFLKPRLKGLLVLIAFWLVVRFLHSEYLSYVELSGNTQYLVVAALGKITLYVLAFLVYVLIVERKILQRTQQDIDVRTLQERAAGEDDGFDFIRNKKSLSNPADNLLDK